LVQSSRKKGVFDPTIIHQTRYWHPLEYLTTLSTQIEEKNPESVPLLIKVIKRITESNPQNTNLYWRFVEIVSNLSTANINDDILDLIPKWLNISDNTLVSIRILEKLLPKFYESEPSSDEIEKGERILAHLFEMVFVEDKNEKQHFGAKSFDYKSQIELHFLNNALSEKKLLIKIITYSGEFLLDHLAHNLKTLHTHFPNGIALDVKSHDSIIQCQLHVVKEVLILRVLKKTLP
jgi:hypothetical protein